MRLIDRYLLRQLLGPTLLATASLAGVALLIQSLGGLELLVTQRQSGLTFLKIVLLYMPQLINMILPVAVFVAALVALNRLHTEQEIVVCFAGGMSRWQVIAPAMRVACTVALIALVVNIFLQPMAFRELRESLFDVKADLASTLVREGEFTEPAKGLTVYAQSVDGKGNLKNLFIHQSKPNDSATTYSAQSGHIAKQQGRPVLVMQNGSMQEFSDKGVLQYLAFSRYDFDLGDLTDPTALVHYKESDRYLHELFFPDLQQSWEQRNRVRMLAEGHARMATPLYNVAFMALALAAIIGGGFSRLGYGRRIAITCAAAAMARILGFLAFSGSQSNEWLNVVQYAVPLGATALAFRSLFRQRVSRFIDMQHRPTAIATGAAA